MRGLLSLHPAPPAVVGPWDHMPHAGAILLLVLDGRSISTLGASMEDVVNILLEHGAVNAGNLDGGSSSVMVYQGEIINHCSSVTGPRRVPTGFIVLKAGEADD